MEGVSGAAEHAHTPDVTTGGTAELPPPPPLQQQQQEQSLAAGIPAPEVQTMEAEADDPADRLEITSEGAAGGPGGLKKVFFLKEKLKTPRGDGAGGGGAGTINLATGEVVGGDGGSSSGGGGGGGGGYGGGLGALGKSAPWLTGLGSKFGAMKDMVQDSFVSTAAKSNQQASSSSASGTPSLQTSSAQAATTSVPQESSRLSLSGSGNNMSSNGTAAAASQEQLPPPPPPSLPPTFQYWREYRLTYESAPLPFSFALAGSQLVIDRSKTATATEDGQKTYPSSGAIPTQIGGISLGSDATPQTATDLVSSANFPLTVHFKEPMDVTAEQMASGGGGGRGSSGITSIGSFTTATGGGGALGGAVFTARVKAMKAGIGQIGQLFVKEAAESNECVTDSVCPSVDFTFRVSGADLPLEFDQLVSGGEITVYPVQDDEKWLSSLTASLPLPPPGGGGDGDGDGSGVSSGDAGSDGDLATAAEVEIEVGLGEEEDGKDSQPAPPGRLAAGSILVAVNGRPVAGLKLRDVREVVTSLSPPIVMSFREVLPIYRAVTVEKPQLEEFYTHVATFVPQFVTGMEAHGEVPGTTEYEGVQETSARALRFLNGFRAHGVAVTLKHMQTVPLPRRSRTSINAGVMEGGSGATVQATRVWFQFPARTTVTITTYDMSKCGVKLLKSGEDGSWIVLQIEEGSPLCAHESGAIRGGAAYLLTHVNGRDVSPREFMSLAPRAVAEIGSMVTWATAVTPLLQQSIADTGTATLTLV